VERRVSTENGTFKRGRLLKLLAKYVEELVHDIHVCPSVLTFFVDTDHPVQRKSIRVEKGYEKYELAWRSRGLPSIWRDCLITRLVHISGSNWQVELYVRV
jgi:hypothetical protein